MKAKSNPQLEIKRMNINVDVQLHDRFKAATAAEGKNMTDVLMDFIRQYVEQHLPDQLRRGARK